MKVGCTVIACDTDTAKAQRIARNLDPQVVAPEAIYG